MVSRSIKALAFIGLSLLVWVAWLDAQLAAEAVEASDLLSGTSQFASNVSSLVRNPQSPITSNTMGSVGGTLDKVAPDTTPTPPPCGLAWRVVPSPNRSSTTNSLNDLAVVSSNDVWAVGVYEDSNLGGRVLSLRWDGSQWNVVDAPHPGGRTAILRDIDVLSASDIWAVGRFGGGAGSTLVEHWDGNQWSIIPSPNPGYSTSEFFGVDALSSNDVWAVGYRDIISGGYGIAQTLIEHWDGTQWSVVPSPNVGSGNNHLRDVAAVSPNNVWAVGSYAGSGVDQTLILHWDGTEWSVVPSPNPVGSNQLFGIWAASANDVWAVGSGNPFSLILHWDGTQWSHIPSPNPNQGNFLFAVSGTGPNDVWAVGHHCCNGDWNWTLVLHWDGSQWSVVPSPSPGQILSVLDGVAAVSSIDVWAVGTQKTCGGCPYNTLTERYSDPCAGATPSPTPPATQTSTATPSAITGTPTAIPTSTSTATVGTTSTPTRTPHTTATSVTATSTLPPPPTSTATTSATATSIPPSPTISPTVIATSTAVPTSTPCPVQFSDVLPRSTFYEFVRCLACRGIVSGYADGTFRPNNDVTRGQLAKIVSNAAGFGEDPGPQIFEDVPPSNPFYPFINRLTNRGHMSGYPCGGPGEPCINNRPYFRWGSPATRGQTSKIVANAAMIDDPIPPDRQTFEDVPPAHTFWLWIERLAGRGVMGGYVCGGPGEPCGPGNRPYFRPQNNVTRGQSAKIVANTFYPNCQSP